MSDELHSDGRIIGDGCYFHDHARYGAAFCGVRQMIAPFLSIVVLVFGFLMVADRLPDPFRITLWGFKAINWIFQKCFGGSSKRKLPGRRR